MADTIDKVITVAKAENGYLEKSKSAWNTYGTACLYDKKRYAGEDNYTKYGYEMHKIKPSVMDFPAYWCDAYVDWCFYKAYGASDAEAMLGGFDDYTKGSIQKYKNMNAFFLRVEKAPEKGDQVFFTKDGTLTGVHHTGLVIDVDSQYVYTSEGNTTNSTEVVRNGGCVAEKKYRNSDSRIYGYGRPKYSSDEKRSSGWVKSGNKWYYRISEGINAHGWKLIENSDGNRRWYYFDEKTGAMKTGWIEVNGEKYYLEEKGDFEGACYISGENGAQHIWIVK